MNSELDKKKVKNSINLAIVVANIWTKFHVIKLGLEENYSKSYFLSTCKPSFYGFQGCKPLVNWLLWTV